MEETNRLLQEEFDAHLNGKFARVPRSPLNFHCPVPKGTSLRDVFCLEEARVLSNDWAVSFYNRIFQIAKLNSPLPRPKNKIAVRIWEDGSIHLLHNEQRLVFKSLVEKPQ